MNCIDIISPIGYESTLYWVFLQEPQKGILRTDKYITPNIFKLFPGF